MPFSQSSQLSTIVGCAEQLQPRSVLDVGVGMGQYGFLLRTNLESLNLFEIDGATGRQAPRERWKVRIDGIEGFPGYFTPVHSYAYNQLFVGDALQLLPTIPDQSYDFVMAIDILEHFQQDDGERFLTHCRRIARRVALVSTPKEFIEQTVEANPFEDHKSVWSRESLESHGFTRILANGESWIAAFDRVEEPVPA
jgi:ubiquinone/menaquinone biosynthesis C-methylase UbiE